MEIDLFLPSLHKFKVILFGGYAEFKTTYLNLPVYSGGHFAVRSKNNCQGDEQSLLLKICNSLTEFQMSKIKLHKYLEAKEL